MARVSATGGFTAAAQTSAVLTLRGPFNLTLWNTFVATVVLEKSIDGGATWVAVSRDGTGTGLSWTAPIALTVEEIDLGVQYRLRCSAFTSGTASYKISGYDN